MLNEMSEAAARDEVLAILGRIYPERRFDDLDGWLAANLGRPLVFDTRRAMLSYLIPLRVYGRMRERMDVKCSCGELRYMSAALGWMSNHCFAHHGGDSYWIEPFRPNAYDFSKLQRQN